MSVPSPAIRHQADANDPTIGVIIGMVKQARIHYVQLGMPQFTDDEDDTKEQYLSWQLATIRSCFKMSYVGHNQRALNISAENLSKSWLKATAGAHCFIWPMACNQDICDSFVSIMEVIRARDGTQMFESQESCRGVASVHMSAVQEKCKLMSIFLLVAELVMLTPSAQSLNLLRRAPDAACL
ncbi:hypothetical protein MMC29_000186 [Sticta canariensis]|nr:hypothetical protein [Sticta canariensis]